LRAIPTVELSNTGNATLSIYSLTITGANANHFAEQAITCGSWLLAGHYCTIGVWFKPLAVGSCNASLSIKDNASNSPQTVSLSGTTEEWVLSWTASPTPGVVGYHVYRGTSVGGLLV
jgi:hypothetical protein